MRYRDFDGDEAYDPPKPGHSMIGIVSFLIVLAAGLLEMGLLVVVGIIDAQNPGGIDEDSPQAIVLGLALIGGIFVDIVGVVLGIVALFQPSSNKAFAWLGVGIGTTMLVGILLLFAAGIALSTM